MWTGGRWLSAKDGRRGRRCNCFSLALQIFDDRQWRSFLEIHSACRWQLPWPQHSGCSLTHHGGQSSVRKIAANDQLSWISPRGSMLSLILVFGSAMQRWRAEPGGMVARNSWAAIADSGATGRTYAQALIGDDGWGLPSTLHCGSLIGTRIMTHHALSHSFYHLCPSCAFISHASIRLVVFNICRRPIH